MPTRIIIALVSAVIGYAIGLFGGSWLVPLLSSNRHDVQIELAMTGALFWGPLAAVLGLILGLALTRRVKPRP